MTKKNLLQNVAIAGLLSAIAAPPVNAELLFSENFDYVPGNFLPNDGGWHSYGANKNEAPLQIVAQSLVYPGYQTTAVGGALRLAGNLNGKDQSTFHDITGTDTPQDIYVSALICVNSVPDDCKAPSIAFVSNNYKGYVDESSPTAKGNLFILPGSTEGHFKLGLSKATVSAAVTSANEF